MQPLLARLRSLRPARFNSSTGRRRRGGVALAAGVALALIAGSGIAVAAVSSASAHTPAINSDCTGVHVQAFDYNDAVVNTVTVTNVGGNPDGSDHVENRTFGAGFDEWFTFPDPSVGWSFSASIDAPDGTNGTEWDYSWSDTTSGCSTPDIGVTATTCIHAGDLTAVNAVISPLDPAHSYTVQLTGSNGYDSGEAPIQTTTASWGGLTPGVDYTATLRDKTTGLSDSDSVHAIGCPENPDFTVSITQCTTVDGNGTFGVTVSGLVAGRDYVLALVNNVGGAPTEVPFTATAATFSNSFSTAPSGTYFVRITDVADGTSEDSNTATFLPCPGMPDPILDPTQCTSTSGVSDASMVSSVDQLIPGRSYSITIVTGATTVYSESLAPAVASTWTRTLFNLDPGVYTLTVIDTTDPASAGFTASTSSTIAPCPTQPEISLSLQECSIPGGQGSLTGTLSNLAVGGAYRATLWQGGAPDPRTDNTILIAAYPGTTFDIAWDKLTPGVAYRIVVTDDIHPGVTAAADIVMKACPGNPDVILTQPTCTVFTTSTITVNIDKLVTGQTYTASVTTTADGQPVSGVPAQQVDGTTPTALLQFTGVPVGRNYTITVANATKTLTATGTILLTLCDLPTLAYTGASTMTPTLAGLGFLQFGLVLVGISLVRRRSGAREV